MDGTDPMFNIISKFTNPTMDGSEASTMHSDDLKDALNHNGELDCLSDVTTRESGNTPTSGLEKAQAAMRRSHARDMESIPNPFEETPAERQRLEALDAEKTRPRTRCIPGSDTPISNIGTPRPFFRKQRSLTGCTAPEQEGGI